MTKSFGALAFSVIVVGLAIGVGIGMWQSGNLAFANPTQANQPIASSASSGGSAGPSLSSPQATASPREQNQTTGRAMPGGVVGAIEEVGAGYITVRTAQISIKVILSANTTVRKTTGMTLPQIVLGEDITVVGQRGADGVVVAQSVQAGVSDSREDVTSASGAMMRQPSSLPGEQLQGARGAMAVVSGTVESVGEGKLVIKTANGSVTVSISAQTNSRRTVEGDLADIVVGVNVLATGQQSAEGLAATSIQLMTEAGGTPAQRRPMTR